MNRERSTRSRRLIDVLAVVVAAAALLVGLEPTAQPARAAFPLKICLFVPPDSYHCLAPLDALADDRPFLLADTDIVARVDPVGTDDATVATAATGLRDLLVAEVTADLRLADRSRRDGWTALDAAARGLRHGLPLRTITRVDGAPADRTVVAALSTVADAIGDLTDARRRPSAVDRIEAGVETLARHLG